MTDKLREAALWKLLTEAREALWQPANPDLCGRIDEALAQQESQKKHKPLFAEMIAQHPGLAEELAQQDAQAVPVVWMGKMDFEALKLRGRVTATLYGEPVGNKTHEVGLCLATPTPPCRRNNHD